MKVFDAPWMSMGVEDMENGPNPFRDIEEWSTGTGTAMQGSCASCFVGVGSGMVPRDESGNCTCANGTSIARRDAPDSDVSNNDSEEPS